MEWHALSQDLRIHYATFLVDILEAPFKDIGVYPVIESEEYTDYALAQLHALNLALKVPFHERARGAETE